jgi:hypothetical protein
MGSRPGGAWVEASEKGGRRPVRSVQATARKGSSAGQR